MHYYSLSDISSMMRAAGLDPLATYGVTNFRVSDEAFDPDSSTAMAILAVKRPGWRSTGMQES